MNVVMTGNGGFVELQGTAEGAPFSAQADGVHAAARQRRHTLAGCRAEARARAVRRRLILASSNAAKLREISTMLDGSVLGHRAAERTWGRGSRRTSSNVRRERTREGASCVSAQRAAGARRRLWTVRRVARRRARRALGTLRWRGRERSEQQRRVAAAPRGATQRRAHYICVLVAVRSAEDAEPIVVDARWYGEITQAPRGSGGFGYDPLFYVPSLGLTAAELDPAHKNRISHRGLALRTLAATVGRLELMNSTIEIKSPRLPAANADVSAYLRPGSLNLRALPPLALYVHYPWCVRKCPYCDFNSHEVSTARCR